MSIVKRIAVLPRKRAAKKPKAGSAKPDNNGAQVVREAQPRMTD
ncbi:hypothetical protein [Sphingomicrobium sediminis]|nr:hypothetical protein [Sphingomicrobium sediminis]